MERLKRQFGALMTACCRNRRLFVTSRELSSRTQSGYFCLGPAKTEPTDIVCVLLGCDVPVVLRPRCSATGTAYNYDFVDQAYVDILMEYQGDLAQDIRNGTVVLSDFLVT